MSYHKQMSDLDLYFCHVHLAPRFLGTSGQNIHDFEKYSEGSDKVEFLERTLKWRHIAPTAPNTLGRLIHCTIFIFILL